MEHGFTSWEDFTFSLNCLAKYFGHRGRLDRFRDLYIEKSQHEELIQEHPTRMCA